MLITVQKGDITYDCLKFICPGCALNGSGIHILPVNNEIIPSWSWNGDTDKPTLSPSIKTTVGNFVCHSFLVDGEFSFLPDSTHELGDMRAKLPDLPYIDKL